MRFCIRFVVSNRSYLQIRNQYENNDIPEEPEKLKFAPIIFELNNFSFLIDIIDNIIYASGTCHQNSNQWQCSIIVTCLVYIT